MTRMLKAVRAYHRTFARFCRDKRGLAAVEFAFIVPVMLTLVFGTIEVASVVAIDRKVSLVARTLSDLVSRGPTVTDVDLKNFFGMGASIMTPYQVTPDAGRQTMGQKITALNVDASKVVKVAWSFAATITPSGSSTSVNVTTGYATGTTITTVPAALLVPNTQLIWSEVNYTYYPILGYLIAKVFPMNTENNYTRPRQSVTVTYSPT